uniref:Uncharacterized protein n=1 Tax=Ditylenchus dipsaci TaxID=166011 RepID=A0A915EJQ0_9BILA
MTQKHNHFGDKSRVDLKRMQRNFQEQAISSKEAPRNIWFAEQMEPILDYFEDSYVGRPNGENEGNQGIAID